IGADGGASVMVTRDSQWLSTGVGVSGHGGYRLTDELSAEFRVAYSRWDSAEGYVTKAWHFDASPGLRWTFWGQTVRPSLAAHLGYGHLDVRYSDTSGGGDGLAVDAGVGLDIAFSSLVGARLHAAWNQILIAKGDGWVDLGAGLTLTL